MTISSDLFLSILSMDAYNRDYDAGIDISGSRLGGAQILSRDSLGISESDYQAWQTVGFYALAYELQADEQIEGLSQSDILISYRGTDNVDFTTLGEGASDFWQGWITGAGVPGSQSWLALDFFESVTGSDALSGESSGAILTGHSLGGGLAGLVAALSGDQAVIIDNMPYGAAASLLSMWWNAQQLGTDVATLFANGEPDNYVWPTAGNITAYSVENEALVNIRALETVAATLLLGPLGAFAGANAILMSFSEKTQDPLEHHLGLLGLAQR